MDPERIKGLIRTGKVYDLGMEYYVGMPHHPNHPPFAFSLTKLHGDVPYKDGVSACNCLFTTGGHTGTHFDSLGHISVKGEVHGVKDIAKWQDYQGLKKVGIETVKPVVTRGVLLGYCRARGDRLSGFELPHRFQCPEACGGSTGKRHRQRRCGAHSDRLDPPLWRPEQICGP